jgi:hypothetical protein
MLLIDTISIQLKNKNILRILDKGFESGKHKIDVTESLKWIQSQYNINTRLGDVATAIIKTNRVLTYSEVKNNILNTLLWFSKDYEGDYIIISEGPKKSGYLFTMLWIMLCDQNKIRRPIEVVDSTRQNPETEKDVVAVVINDMDYTGNSMSTFLNLTKSNSSNVKAVYIVRGFTTDRAIEQITKSYSKKHYKVIFCIGDILPSFEEALVSEYGTKKGNLLFKDANRFWGGYDKYGDYFDPPVLWLIGHTNVFLEYKLADAPSTLLYVYLLGLVPTKTSYPNEVCIDESKIACIDFNRINFKELKGPESYSLITGCKYNQRVAYSVFKTKFDGDLRKVIENGNLLQDLKRCPRPWYKSIDWETGIVS